MLKREYIQRISLFFLSLFTFVIAPETPKGVVIVSSLIMVIETIVWFSLVSVFFTQPKVVQTVSRFQNMFNKIVGGCLVFLGIKVMFMEK